MILALILGAEAIAASVFLDSSNIRQAPGILPQIIRNGGPWAIRFGIAFAALYTAFAYLRYKPALLSASALSGRSAIDFSFLAIHFLALVVFSAASIRLYGGTTAPSNELILLFVAAAITAVLCAGLAVAPWRIWSALFPATRNLAAYTCVAAGLACYSGVIVRALWEHTAGLTFQVVRLLLSLFVPDLFFSAADHRIGTPRFTVIIAPECSGLEGMGLLVIFATVWLFVFRDEIRFPRALVLLPAAVVALFLLNCIRIGALVLIGDAGSPAIAAGGFHSQAGWIGFCSVAFCLAVGARRMSWLTITRPARPAEKSDNPVAPYLVPFLAIIAAGFISRAASDGFEWLYGIRLFAAMGAFWVLRRAYSSFDWKFGWWAALTGILGFVVWIALDVLLNHPPAHSRMPESLASAGGGIRVIWIFLRIAAATVTVPLAEELAFRGFLLRRFVSKHFESVPYQAAGWVPVIASSFVFGLLHGERWPAATIVGILYALAVRRTGRIGEAAGAHAVTNLMLACYVLLFTKWYFW